MDALPIPDWIREIPDVARVEDFHLPAGSGISGPPAGAYLVEGVVAANAIRSLPMWHVLLDVTDMDLEELSKSRVLVVAFSVVPVFQVYPLPRRIDGSSVDDDEGGPGRHVEGAPEKTPKLISDDDDGCMREDAAALVDRLAKLHPDAREIDLLNAFLENFTKRARAESADHPQPDLGVCDATGCYHRAVTVEVGEAGDLHLCQGHAT